MKGKHILRIALGTLALLSVPLIAMQFTSEVNWDETDFIVMGILLFGSGLVYEFLASQRGSHAYKIAVGIGVLGVLLLGWVSGAVGIIGSENNPANLLYWAVPAVGIVGSLLSRFRPRGMSYTLSATAAVQFLVPLFALFIWPAQTSWGAAGVHGVLIFNTVFAVLFLASALLFRRAASQRRFSDLVG